MAQRPLTDRDMETLGELIACQDSALRYHGEKARQHGFAPMEFGGGSNSHHGATATKLAKRGLADHRQLGAEWGDVTTQDARGSKSYRPTEAGRAAYQAWRDARQGASNG